MNELGKYGLSFVNQANVVDFYAKKFAVLGASAHGVSHDEVIGILAYRPLHGVSVELTSVICQRRSWAPRRELTASVGATQLAREHSININSATALIRDYRHLRKGECYRRTLSTPAADVFLHRIFTEDGAGALAPAIAAVWAHIAYYERARETTVRALLDVVARHEEQLRRHEESTTLAQTHARFEHEIALALSDTGEARRRRLALAPRKPATITVTTEVFVRNPDVVAEVLDRADGKCEICHDDAPFPRRDGSPYLEIHHVVQLADGGEDTTENAVAVCPNCHRRVHYGPPAQE